MTRLTNEIKDRMGIIIHNLNVGDTIGKSTLEELQNIYDELFDTDASLMKQDFEEVFDGRIVMRIPHDELDFFEQDADEGYDECEACDSEEVPLISKEVSYSGTTTWFYKCQSCKNIWEL